MATPPGIDPGTGHVVIIGGAIIGSFTAWSLRQEGFAGPITVIEKDRTYQFSSTALSAAGIRTQFATATNVAMSLYAVEVFRHLDDLFGPNADIGFRESGYLILGGASDLGARSAAAAMQNDIGADVVCLDPDELARRFPFLHLDDIGIGTFGRSGEGWFDAWSLLMLVRQAALRAGVTYIDGTVDRLTIDDERIVRVGLSDGTTLDCDWCVIAAGPASGRLAQLIEVDLPVVPRKRTVFCFQSPVSVEGFPFVCDDSGIWIRPEGHLFIGGVQPPSTDDPDADGDFEPHHRLLEDAYWPALAHRIPAMDRLRMTRSWAGHYEVNTLDHNGVIGPHDEILNLVFATGFSGHGVMHAPATGRGVAELITTGRFQTIDLTPLGWDRIRNGEPLTETAVY